MHTARRLSPAVFRPSFPVGPLTRFGKRVAVVFMCVYIHILYIVYITHYTVARLPRAFSFPVYHPSPAHLCRVYAEEFRLSLQKCHASPPPSPHPPTKDTSRPAGGFLDLRAFYEFSAARRAAWSLPATIIYAYIYTHIRRRIYIYMYLCILLAILIYLPSGRPFFFADGIAR